MKCYRCKGSNVFTERRLVEFERGGSVVATVHECRDCQQPWIADESLTEVSMAMANRPMDQQDKDFLASLDEAGKAELQEIADLARKAFPSKEAYVTFFAAANPFMEMAPGEMVNTAEGRAEVKEFLERLIEALETTGDLD